ncbi:uncharacterized protein [Gossypium hirsutum]|uniref:Tf2-1-like SH3-like domain-containing protein n=1 Tax=Gossypium hirsutum TaxID=3635 RepID=A0A1U8PKD3_GOSHI|nr:uncharacterized protein LOC107959962 [Gossypium hirsutum]
MAPYEALYCRKCQTPLCWTELGERRVLGIELVFKTKDNVKLIWDGLKVAFDREKSYADFKRHDIEYFVGEFVFLKVSQWKKVLRLSAGPYRILKRVGLVAYQLELPLELDCNHDVFHVSMLRRYQYDPSHVVAIEENEVRPDLTFEEESVPILDRDVKVLRRKFIPLVKVLWQNHGAEEATWELVDLMRQQYSHMF